MPSPSEIALEQLERVLGRDPLLRDIVHQTLPRGKSSDRFVPEYDLLELPDRYVIVLDVPGVRRDDLEVELQGGKLLIRGTKGARHPADARIKSAERSAGAFQREFQLPGSADGAGVTARLSDGVLTVEIPRGPAAKAVKVEVG